MAQDLSRSQVELDPLQLLAKSTPSKPKKITGFEDIITGMRSCNQQTQFQRIQNQTVSQTHFWNHKSPSQTQHHLLLLNHAVHGRRNKEYVRDESHPLPKPLNPKLSSQSPHESSSDNNSMHQFALSSLTIPLIFKLVFVPKSNDFFRLSRISHKFFKIPIYLVSKIDKHFEKKVLDSFFVDIETKDRRHLRFSFFYDQFPVGNDITLTLFRTCFPTATRIKKEMFTYEFRMKYELKHEGWKVYDVLKEFKRQGVEGLEIEESQSKSQKGFIKHKKGYDHPLPSPKSDSVQNMSGRLSQNEAKYPFRLTRANEEFRLSWSYPQLLVVP